MINYILFYLGGAIPLIWGIAHLFPTKSVVEGFGEINLDNKHIITMEWIIEGVSLIFIGIIVIGTTMIGSINNLSNFIYLSAIFVLIILTIVSLFTGYKINYLPFKLCPFLFSLSAILLILGLVF